MEVWEAAGGWVEGGGLKVRVGGDDGGLRRGRLCHTTSHHSSPPLGTCDESRLGSREWVRAGSWTARQGTGIFFLDWAQCVSSAVKVQVHHPEQIAVQGRVEKGRMGHDSRCR